MRKITNKMIRDYLGHNGCECLVRIGRHGVVLPLWLARPF
jgi:hypothetical protein